MARNYQEKQKIRGSNVCHASDTGKINKNIIIIKVIQALTKTDMTYARYSKKEKRQRSENMIPMVVTSYSRATMITKPRLFNLLQTKRKTKVPTQKDFFNSVAKLFFFLCVFEFLIGRKIVGIEPRCFLYFFQADPTTETTNFYHFFSVKNASRQRDL